MRKMHEKNSKIVGGGKKKRDQEDKEKITKTGGEVMNKEWQKE